MEGFGKPLAIDDPESFYWPVFQKLEPILVDAMIVIDVLLEAFHFLAPIGYHRDSRARRANVLDNDKVALNDFLKP